MGDHQQQISGRDYSGRQHGIAYQLAGLPPVTGLQNKWLPHLSAVLAEEIAPPCSRTRRWVVGQAQMPAA
jgi:hypothetical protein